MNSPSSCELLLIILHRFMVIHHKASHIFFFCPCVFVCDWPCCIKTLSSFVSLMKVHSSVELLVNMSWSHFAQYCIIPSFSTGSRDFHNYFHMKLIHCIFIHIYIYILHIDILVLSSSGFSSHPELPNLHFSVSPPSTLLSSSSRLPLFLSVRRQRALTGWFVVTETSVTKS